MTCYTKLDLQNEVTDSIAVCEKSIFQPVKRLLKTLDLWSKRAEERKQLATVDERLLKDMGITRYQADQEISKPFWRD